MTDRHKISITDRQIILDGQDITGAVRRVSVETDGLLPPQVWLDLNIHEVTRLDSEHAEVLIPGNVVETLIALGWTPPGAQTEGERTQHGADSRYLHPDTTTEA